MSEPEHAPQDPKGYGDYDPKTAIDDWGRIARTRAPRDRVLIPRIAKYLRPGSVLELGSAYGDVAERFRALGFDVTASDYYPHFVEHLRRIGLKAEVVDATDIQATMPQQFDNVYAQGLTPHMRYFPAGMTEAVNESVHKALKPGGIFLVQTTNYPAFLDPVYKPNSAKRGTYYTHEQELEIIKRQGLFDVVKVFRYQVLPSRLYKLPWPINLLLHAIDLFVPWLLPTWGIRSIWVLRRRG